MVAPFLQTSVVNHDINTATMKRFAFRSGSNLIVFRVGATTNAKISAPKVDIVQTYTFSRSQFEHISNGGNIMGLFAHDGDNCLDCPFRGNDTNTDARKGGCYTHKFPQARGFASMLKSISLQHTWDTVPEMPRQIPVELLKASAGLYIRFGTYGEPSLIPSRWVTQLCGVAKSWTGYTHQWAKAWAQVYSNYFMASAHNNFEQAIAADMGWRSFIASDGNVDEAGMVHCPASSESGYKSTCAACGLCSGAEGKGKKSVVIFEH